MADWLRRRRLLRSLTDATTALRHMARRHDDEGYDWLSRTYENAAKCCQTVAGGVRCG